MSNWWQAALQDSTHEAKHGAEEGSASKTWLGWCQHNVIVEALWGAYMQKGELRWPTVRTKKKTERSCWRRLKLQLVLVTLQIWCNQGSYQCYHLFPNFIQMWGGMGRIACCVCIHLVVQYLKTANPLDQLPLITLKGFWFYAQLIPAWLCQWPEQSRVLTHHFYSIIILIKYWIKYQAGQFPQPLATHVSTDMTHSSSPPCTCEMTPSQTHQKNKMIHSASTPETIC